MNEILDFYQQQASARLSTIPWLAQLQSKALKKLNHYGFPGRHDEEWKYTRVDSLLAQHFTAGNREVVTLPDSRISDLPITNQVVIHNGQISALEQLAQEVPAGVLILPLTTALAHHPELLQPYLAKILHEEHGFHCLNTAMLHSGIVIYIPQNVCLKTPIVLAHRHDQENQAVYLRHLIIAEAGSQATIIEDYQGEEGTCYLTNTITEIFVGADAKIAHCKLQRESKTAYHLGHVAVQQGRRSEFANHSLSLGGKCVRSDLSVYLQEEKAYCLMNGIYAPAEGQHIDHHTTVHHLVPGCSSEQDYKGILSGHSRAVFNGKVLVAKEAQHTDAKQQNKNLILSAHAEVDTKPQLEIFADDVQCSHGATVGQLDEEALFYLATRGIDRVEASHYLIHAFAQDNLRLIPQSKLAELMSHLLIQQLG